MGLRGKVAVVTGGGQGIGKAIVARLLRDGMDVAIAEADAAAGAETAAALAGHGTVASLPTDVADEGQVRATIAAAANRFGRLDALVNNAGISDNRPLAELSLADWNRVLAINLTGMFLCAKYAAPHLKAARGAIVNIASTRALMSEPNTEAYSASKGGVVALTHALSISLGPDVRVNCISPGWIDVAGWHRGDQGRTAELSETDHAQHPAGRVGKPEDIAGLVAYLLGPEAGFITGANFVVDGGMTRKMIYA